VAETIQNRTQAPRQDIRSHPEAGTHGGLPRRSAVWATPVSSNAYGPAVDGDVACPGVEAGTRGGLPTWSAVWAAPASSNAYGPAVDGGVACPGAVAPQCCYAFSSCRRVVAGGVQRRLFFCLEIRRRGSIERRKIKAECVEYKEQNKRIFEIRSRSRRRGQEPR
jgi:hypothetical protein